MSRWRRLDLVLLAAVAPLGVWAIMLGYEREEAEATYARLVAAAGDLVVADASKIYLKAVPTGQPLRFSWRAYFPPGPFSDFGGTPPNGPGGGSGHSAGSVCEGVFKVSFREREDGDGFDVIRFAGQFGGSSQFGDRSLVELLRGRWDRVEVEQAAVAGPVAGDADAPLTLLRLRIPPDILAEGRAMPSGLARTIPAVFYEYTINPPATPPASGRPAGGR